MAESRLIQKQLAGKEDLLLGIGTVSQARATGVKTITKLNATHFGGVLVVDTINDLNTLDKNQLDEQVVLVKENGNTYIYNGTSWVNKTAAVEKIEDLAIYPGLGSVVVKDINRGGTFVSKTEADIDPSTGALYTVNEGTVFAKSGGGFWVRQYSGAVNVKWFGAKGDGVTDDTIALQNAINSKKSISGDNFSTYKILSTLVLPIGLSDVSFNFNGATFDITELNSTLFEITQNVSRIEIKNFVVEGDSLNTNSKVIEDNVYDANKSNHAKSVQLFMSNISSTNVATFSNLALVRDSKFDRIRVSGSSFGFRFYGLCNEISIINCTVLANTAPIDIYAYGTASGVSFCEGIISTACTYELTGADNSNPEVCAAVRGEQGQHIVFRDCWIGSSQNTKNIAGAQDFYNVYFNRSLSPDSNMVNTPVIQGCNLHGARLLITNSQNGIGRLCGFNISGNTFTVSSDYAVDNAIYINGYNSGTVFSNNIITIMSGVYTSFISFYRQESLVFTSNAFKQLGGTIDTFLTVSLSQDFIENSNNYKVSYAKERVISNSTYSTMGKHIISKTENENGKSIMYSDGTMIAYGKNISSPLNANSEGNIAYPVLFSNYGVPVVSMSVSGYNQLLTESAYWSTNNARFGFKLVDIATGSGIKPNESIAVSYYAIGRWK